MRTEPLLTILRIGPWKKTNPERGRRRAPPLITILNITTGPDLPFFDAMEMADPLLTIVTMLRIAPQGFDRIPPAVAVV